MNVNEAVRVFKTRLIKGALELNDGNIRATARMLGTSRNNLIRWSKTLDLFDYAAQLRKEARVVRLSRGVYSTARVAVYILAVWNFVVHVTPALG